MGSTPITGIKNCPLTVSRSGGCFLFLVLRGRTGRRHRTAPAGAFRRPTGAKRRLLGRRCARTNSPVDCWLARGRPPSPAFLIPKPFSGLGIFCVADKIQACLPFCLPLLPQMADKTDLFSVGFGGQVRPTEFSPKRFFVWEISFFQETRQG